MINADTEAEALAYTCYSCESLPGHKCKTMGRTYGTRGLAKNKGRLTLAHESRINQVRRAHGLPVR